jgi:hypothetical protein
VRFKLILASMVVTGSALISYGLGFWGVSKPHESGVLQITNSRGSARQHDHSSQSESTKEPRYLQKVADQFKEYMAQPIMPAPRQTHHTDSQSVARKNYQRMKSCLETNDVSAQLDCAGIGFSDYYEYKNNIEINFVHELKLHVADLQSGAQTLIYDDQILAHEILLNESRADLRVEALELLKIFPPSSENLQVLEVSLATCTDSEVLQKGFEVLELYKSAPHFDSAFDNIVEEQIRLGLGAETLKITTRELLEAMNAERYRYYMQIYNELQQAQEKNQMAVKGPNQALNEKLRSLASVLQEYRAFSRDTE